MKATVVYKKSVYELYSGSSDAHAAAFIAGDSKRARYHLENHDMHERSRKIVAQALERHGIASQFVYRADLTHEITEQSDIVVTLGGDGTLLDASHYVSDTPVIGVNSSERSSVGFLCGANPRTLDSMLCDLRSAPRSRLSRIRIEIDGAPTPELALNDVLFADPNPAEMSTYGVIENGQERTYRSSGLLACTSVGSTAFMWNEGGSIMDLSSRKIQYTHRSLRERDHRIVDDLEMVSYAREGRIWIDGSHVTHPVPIGSRMVLSNAEPLVLLGDLAEARRTFLEKRFIRQQKAQLC